MPATLNTLRRSVFFERAFVGVVVFTLGCFAYYLTQAQTAAVEASHQNQRTIFMRALARDVASLLDKKQSLSARLANVLDEVSVRYAVVQRARDGSVEAKGDGPGESLSLAQVQEALALKARGLTWLPYSDPSGSGETLVEGVLPVMVGSERLVLRVGFVRDEQDRVLRHIVFRNLLVLAVIVLGFVFYWLIKHRDVASVRVIWLGGAAILVLAAFIASHLLLEHWYDRAWRRQFKKTAIGAGQLMAPVARRFAINERAEDATELAEMRNANDDIAFIAVVKGEKAVFHTEADEIGKSFEDPHLKGSRNDDVPLLRHSPDDPLDFRVYVPLLQVQGTNAGRGSGAATVPQANQPLMRVGTLVVGIRAHAWIESRGVLVWQMGLVFLGALGVAFVLVHLISRRLSRDVNVLIHSMEQVTAGDLRQSVYLERHDEVGLLAQTYNFMMLGLRERDMLGKGLQQYVSKSIVNQTLKVIASHENTGEKLFVVGLFAPFHGLGEALNQAKPPDLFTAVRQIVELLRKVAVDAGAAQVQLSLGGAVLLFGGRQKYDALLTAIRCANLLLHRLRDCQGLPFEVPLAIHCFETIHGTLDNEEPTFWGDVGLDVFALARVQDKDEIFLSEDAGFLLRETAEMNEVEVQGERSVRVKAFAFKGFKPHAELVSLFTNVPVHVRVLILKILRTYAQAEAAEVMMGWFPGADPNVRYAILEALEKLPRTNIVPFVEQVVKEDTDARVLSKAIQLLGRLGNENHVPILAEKLRVTDRRVKANAVEALEKIGGNRVYEFFNLLLDESDNRVKANILISLGKYGDLKVFDLLSRMIKDSDKNMRASAAYALGQLGMAQGVEPLISALSDKDPDVRRQVVASLSRLKADLEIDV